MHLNRNNDNNAFFFLSFAPHRADIYPCTWFSASDNSHNYVLAQADLMKAATPRPATAASNVQNTLQTSPALASATKGAFVSPTPLSPFFFFLTL